MIYVIHIISMILKRIIGQKLGIIGIGSGKSGIEY